MEDIIKSSNDMKNEINKEQDPFFIDVNYPENKYKAYDHDNFRDSHNMIPIIPTQHDSKKTNISDLHNESNKLIGHSLFSGNNIISDNSKKTKDDAKMNKNILRKISDYSKNSNNREIYTNNINSNLNNTLSSVPSICSKNNRFYLNSTKNKHKNSNINKNIDILKRSHYTGKSNNDIIKVIENITDNDNVNMEAINNLKEIYSDNKNNNNNKNVNNDALIEMYNKQTSTDKDIYNSNKTNITSDSNIANKLKPFFKTSSHQLNSFNKNSDNINLASHHPSNSNANSNLIVIKKCLNTNIKKIHSNYYNESKNKEVSMSNSINNNSMHRLNPSSKSILDSKAEFIRDSTQNINFNNNFNLLNKNKSSVTSSNNNINKEVEYKAENDVNFHNKLSTSNILPKPLFLVSKNNSIGSNSGVVKSKSKGNSIVKENSAININMSMNRNKLENDIVDIKFEGNNNNNNKLKDNKIVFYTNKNKSYKNSNLNNSSLNKKTCRICLDDNSLELNNSINNNSNSNSNNTNNNSNSSSIISSSHKSKQENILANKLITPCNCHGSIQYIHQYCLKTWIKTNYSKNILDAKCELCNTPYLITRPVFKSKSKAKRDKISTIKSAFLLVLILFMVDASVIIILKNTIGTEVGINSAPFWIIAILNFLTVIIFIISICFSSKKFGLYKDKKAFEVLDINSPRYKIKLEKAEFMNESFYFNPEED